MTIDAAGLYAEKVTVFNDMFYVAVLQTCLVSVKMPLGIFINDRVWID
jgi:hypothetical protein